MDNVAEAMQGIPADIVRRQVGDCHRADPDYGAGLARRNPIRRGAPLSTMLRCPPHEASHCASPPCGLRATIVAAQPPPAPRPRPIDHKRKVQGYSSFVGARRDGRGRPFWI
jgi:hypothetical protein